MKKQPVDVAKVELEAGNNRLLQWVYDEHRKFCQEYLQKKKGCRLEDAEDIFMDAIVILRENILGGRLHHLEGLQNYMLTLCLNRYRERIRAHARMIKEQVLVRETLYETNVGKAADGQRQQRIALTLRALAQLGESCQQLIRYYYVDRLRMSDIAQKMGWKSADVAKATKSRCLRDLIKRIEALQQVPSEVAYKTGKRDFTDS